MLSTEPNSEPVQQPYTMPDSSPMQVMHAVATLLNDIDRGGSPWYTVTEIRIEC